MSSLNGVNSMKKRYTFDKMSNWGISEEKDYNATMEDKVNVRGKTLTGYTNPLVRIREDKLRSLKRALYNSYQSAVIVFDKDDRLEDSEGNKTGFHFRCLINHDKLKVDYEDKILSIPFRQVPVEYEGNLQEQPEGGRFVDTGTGGQFLDQLGKPVLDENGEVITRYRVKPGDTFKWVSGNEGYMPDSYWIIFLQYSEETAYFRGEIRKADDEIEVIPVDQDGNPGSPLIYHGWTTGPNEDEAIWNVKKGVVWNDLYYHKILYITKDQNTEEFFKRFDRVVINGQTWQVQGYNDNYGTSSKNSEGGMIRVALKETYTSTNEIIANMNKDLDQQKESQVVSIVGPTKVQTYDVVTYYGLNGDSQLTIVEENAPVQILEQDTKKIKLEIGQVTKEVSFTIKYGDQELPVSVKPFK